MTCLIFSNRFVSSDNFSVVVSLNDLQNNGSTFLQFSVEVASAPSNSQSGDRVDWQEITTIAVAAGIVVLCVAIGCCYFIARRRSDMKGLQFAQFDDSSAQAGTSFAIPARDLTLTRTIGVGSHGAVWLGRWRRSTVAVKKCSSASVSDVQAFEKECLIMSRLNHFNVVRFYGVSRDSGSRFSVDGSLYLVTEYMPRGSLWEVLRNRDSALSEGMRHQMALDIARGMSYLHSLQPPILHRDLKALNLLVDNSFNVKVADFGIARPRVDDTMTFCGTPKWTAPEVLRMNNYSEKADVFSFGVVLWEMMTAEEPYQDMPLMQVVVNVVRDGMRPPIPDSHAASPYAALMRDCWSEEPSSRPSFDEICIRLEAILTEVEAKDPTFNRRPEGTVTSPMAFSNFSLDSSISSPR